MLPEREGRIVQALIGQVHLTRPPHRLVTVLGSCVGLVLHDSESRLTGMAHILLPDSRGRRVPGLPGRHADEAVSCLLAAFAEMAVPIARLRAWIAGGATMFGDAAGAADMGVGAANLHAVRSALQGQGIPVVDEDVGGCRGRRMGFDPLSGRMSVQVLDQGSRLPAESALAKPP